MYIAVITYRIEKGVDTVRAGRVLGDTPLQCTRHASFLTVILLFLVLGDTPVQSHVAGPANITDHQVAVIQHLPSLHIHSTYTSLLAKESYATTKG